MYYYILYWRYDLISEDLVEKFHNYNGNGNLKFLQSLYKEVVQGGVSSRSEKKIKRDFMQLFSAKNTVILKTCI